MRLRQIALFDIDGTLIPSGGTFKVADHLSQVKLLSPLSIQKINEIRQQYRSGSLGYEDYATSIFDIFAEGLAGQSFNETVAETANHLKGDKHPIYSYSKKLITDLLKTHDVFLITANVQFYAQFFTEYFNATGYESTIFGVNNSGLFTGQVERYLTRGKEKEEVVLELFNNYQKKGSFAFGDSEGDKFMLELVENPICINPTEELEEDALRKGWIITDENNIERIVLEKLA